MVSNAKANANKRLTPTPTSNPNLWDNSAKYIIILMVIYFVWDFITGFIFVESKVIKIAGKRFDKSNAIRNSYLKSSFTLIDEKGSKYIYHNAPIYQFFDHQKSSMNDYERFNVGDRVKITYYRGTIYNAEILNITKL